LEKVRQALVDIAEQGRMAGDVISRIRAQVKKSLPRRKWTSTNLSRRATDDPKMANHGSSYTGLPSVKQTWNLSLDEYLKREKLLGNAQST
jgi:hypothetical protein